MYEINDESLEGWKTAFAKDGIDYKTDQEYYEAIHNFTGFIDTLVEIDRRIKENEATGKQKDESGFIYDNDGNKIIL